MTKSCRLCHVTVQTSFCESWDYNICTRCFQRREFDVLVKTVSFDKLSLNTLSNSKFPFTKYLDKYTPKEMELL